MRIHPIIQQQNGIVSVTMTASFVGDPSDASDQQRIQAYGDPLIDLAGLFTDPAAPTFQFTFPISDLYAGLTTDMQNHTARFMTTLPLVPQGAAQMPFAGYSPYTPPPIQPLQQPLDCVVSDPIHAATVWAAAIEARALAAMTLLRAKTPAQLTSLSDSTI